MKAIILAAGRGSRMKERTATLPKCLTELWGRTLLDWQLTALTEGGIKLRDIAIITGYKPESIRSRHKELTYFHNAAWETTNMVSTLMEAADWLSKYDVLVSYSDIYYTKAAVEALTIAKADLALTYYTNFLELWQARFDDPLSDIESFKLTAESNLREIGQKANSLAEIEGQYMGLLKFTPAGFQEIQALLPKLEKPLAKTDMTALLSFLITQGLKIKAIPYDDVWLEVDTPEDLALYEKSIHKP